MSGDTEVITTVGDVTIRTVLSYLGDGRWRAVYWRGEHAVSCSDYPWHAPMPTRAGCAASLERSPTPQAAESRPCA